MPTLETADGKPVEVTPSDVEAGAAAFQAASNGDGPDPAALPKRAARGPATDGAKPRVTGKPAKAERSRTVKAPSAALAPDKRHAGVKGLAQIGAGITLMLGKATGQDALKADAVTIASAADDIAKACVETAEADPKFAAALDRVCSAGPYAALITVGVGLASQIARNHRPSLRLAGTVDPARLLEAQDKTEAEAADVAAAA